MQIYEECMCKQVHQCKDCLPEEVAIELARRVGLSFILVVRHKGHYSMDLLRKNLFGAGPAERALWHALIRLDSEHM